VAANLMDRIAGCQPRVGLARWAGPAAFSGGTLPSNL